MTAEEQEELEEKLTDTAIAAAITSRRQACPRRTPPLTGGRQGLRAPVTPARASF